MAAWIKRLFSIFDFDMDLMSTEEDELNGSFFRLMMSSYKMEMRPPREYKKKELKDLKSKVIIFSSDDDIFFPADRVFPKAKDSSGILN